MWEKGRAIGESIGIESPPTWRQLERETGRDRREGCVRGEHNNGESASVYAVLEGAGQCVVNDK